MLFVLVIQSFDVDAGPKSVGHPHIPWADMSSAQKTRYVGRGVAQTLYGLTVLYAFLVGLKLMSDGFKLIGGRKSGELFSGIEGNAILGESLVGLFFVVLLLFFCCVWYGNSIRIAISTH